MTHVADKMLIPEKTYRQREDMVPSGPVKPCGLSLLKAHLFTSTWAQLVSKCRRNHHGLGWWLMLNMYLLK
jgi:hypothetical protein